MKKFFKQFKKINSEPIEKANIIWSWIGSFLGILAISYFPDFRKSTTNTHNKL